MTIYMLILVNIRRQKSCTYWTFPDVLLACLAILLLKPYMWLAELPKDGRRCDNPLLVSI